jgi:hypothetical protein
MEMEKQTFMLYTETGQKLDVPLQDWRLALGFGTCKMVYIPF